MDEQVQRLDALTTQLVEHLDEADDEQLFAYMLERNRIFIRFEDHAWTDKERKKYAASMQRILDGTTAIMNRMTALKLEAGEHLSKLANGRKQQESYQPAHETESLFFDRRQ